MNGTSDLLGDLPGPPQREAALWKWRLSEADLSQEELRAFEIWLHADPAHRRAMDAAWKVDRLLDLASEDAGIIALRAQALQAMREGQSGQRRRWPIGVRGIAAVAAALLMAFVTAMWMKPVPAEQYITREGERRVVMLSDGSRLSMDAATQVDVAFDDDRRVLTLRQGRAKVDVAKNPLRPFSVSMADRTVVALGTSFTVELLQRTARVALYEGRVDIIQTPAHFPVGEYRPANGGYRLKPGYELVMSIGGNNGRLSRIEADALSWEVGRLNFNDEPLVSAVERMNRYAKDPILLGEGDFSAYRVSGVFDAGNTAAFVEGVTALLPLSVQDANGKRLLVHKPRS